MCYILNVFFFLLNGEQEGDIKTREILIEKESILIRVVRKLTIIRLLKRVCPKQPDLKMKKIKG